MLTLTLHHEQWVQIGDDIAIRVLTQDRDGRWLQRDRVRTQFAAQRDIRVARVQPDEIEHLIYGLRTTNGD